jgi:uncharacterized repeat protein (TIGR02543 family)
MFRGGGIYVAEGSPVITGSIIYGNEVGQDGLGPNCYGGTSGGYNILGSDCTSPWFSRAETDRTVDPQLGLLADNGGPTRTMLPQTGSPAIDAIPGGQSPCSGSTLRDQRGVARPQGNGCDIGAVEVEVAAPQAPQNVQARGGIGRVSLSWNRVPEAYAYWVYQGSSEGVSKTNYDQRYQVFKDPTSPNESFMVSGLQNNTTYYFVVTAVNRLGESAESFVVSATPVPGYTLSVTVSGGGRVTSNDGRINCGSGETACSATYEPDPPATVTLTATPDTGYVFVGWSEGCTGTSRSVTVTVDANKTCVAQFSNQVTLTVQNQGPGAGTVTSNPSGIDCGQDCSEVYAVGRQVTLTANPAEGSVFAGWSGDCEGTNRTTTVTMSGNKTCTASFETGVTLTVQISGGGTGTVSSDPAGIVCPPTCTAQFMSGSTVSLAATAGQNSFFIGWSGDCSGTSPATSIQLTGNKNCTANFSPAQTLLSEDFSDGIPSTWQVEDGGSGGEDAATWTTTNPGDRSIQAPFSPPFAIVDSDEAGEDATQDEQLITPSIPAAECLGQNGRIFLSFANQFHYYYSDGENEKADVDVSTDGTTWANVLRMEGQDDGYPTPNIKSVELTPHLQGASSFRIRFHYYDANWEWWWAIDNVQVVCVLSGTGGQGSSPPEAPPPPPPPEETVTSPTGSGQVTFQVTGGATPSNLDVAPFTGTPPVSPPSLYQLPHGVYSLTVEGIAPGASITIQVRLPSPAPLGTVWLKLIGGRWVALPVGSDDGDNVITVTLTDGGQGDADGVANGVITDPGGPAIPLRIAALWGDVDCDGVAGVGDALKVLRHVVRLPVAARQPCPRIEERVLAAGAVRAWGDVDGDGVVGAVDALKLLRHLLRLSASRAPGTPSIGGEVEVSPPGE